MPRLEIPSSASIHTLKSFLQENGPFRDRSTPAVFSLHPKWAHMDPMALAMAAAWGGWCQRNGLKVQVENAAKQRRQDTNYFARMGLFDYLGFSYDPGLQEHEEAGRFLPLRKVSSRDDLAAVIADVSALLHLEDEPDGLAAVQYCVSELVRNVLEHSGSQEGAYICAQRYRKKKPHRVSIAVADCGQGIPCHLMHSYPQARDARVALNLAMQPGITGALQGVYGSSDNAGAGLFITRAIAKATHGYFVLISDNAAFRLRRSSLKRDEELRVYYDPFDEPKYDIWRLRERWQGTVAAVEVSTEEIRDFHDFFKWIRSQIPAKRTAKGKIRFT